MTHVRVEAPAKVNLRLRVLAREAGGYHGLETLFCALSLHDTVEAEAGEPGIRLVVEGGIETGPPERNLAVRAAERFYREIGRAPAVGLRLSKRIPAAAGLGGGSSDAAATLRALDALHGGPLPPERLLQLGAELGSDVPFFLGPTPYSLAWSRGERLLALPPLPARPALVLHPGEAMPTGHAFDRLAELRGGAYRPEAHALRLGELTSWEGVEALARNDFEAPAFEAVPRLEAARRALLDGGARIALLAGSGASLFALFDRSEPRDAARDAAAAAGFATWAAETLSAWPVPEQV